ncbi:MAG: ABC transporter permease, partial [Blastocatellia bacterium]|nr:ABC transporter permease [Blastocatellia bacterium]
MFQDLRFGLRMLRKNPGFTAIVVMTLALGIGANSALFSVVNGVLLNPLPFTHSEQLVALHQSRAPYFETASIPYLNFRDLQKENSTFAAMAVARTWSFSLTGLGDAERINAELVTADFFSLLGVPPALGRTFAPGEDEIGAAPVVVISASFWQRKFASAPDVLNKSLTLDDKSYTIAGVLSPGFTLSYRTIRNADVYVPIGQWNTPLLQNRLAGGFYGIGRLKPGVTPEQAQADLDRIMQNLAAAYPNTNKGMGARLIPLKEAMVGKVRQILLLLFGAVGFVLLIACVNTGNLLLARSTGRTREFAIRAALGAGRWRLLRQSLTESTLLALIGGGLGLLIAGWGTKAALAVLPTALPRAEEVGLDGRVVFFTLAISLLTGTLAGLAPALKISQWRLSETLKESGRGAGGGRIRMQGIFVALEMALALVLLIGAGLMIRSLAALWQIDPGFRPDNVLTFGLSLPPTMKTASPEAIRNELRELGNKLNTIPGVRAASLSAGAKPLEFDDEQYFWLEGQPKPEGQSQMNMALVYRVEPGYLAAMGIPLKQGRFFTEQDDRQSPNVIVIDEVFARKYFPKENPLGRRINFERSQAQIVGVVGHVKQWGLDTDEKQSLQAQYYEPFRQMPDEAIKIYNAIGVIMRFESAAGTMGPALYDSVRRAVQSQNSENVIFGLRTMNEVIAGSLAARRFSMTLLGAFAALALLLASIGLYGVISYFVGQRTQELGIRISLGAKRIDVLRLVVNHGMKMTLIGIALGLAAALGLTRLMEKMLYGVSATDPATFVGIALLLTLIA